MIWSLLLACTQESVSTEAEHFARAADPASSLSAALSGCREIEDEDARGDCVSLALERNADTTRKDCASIDSARWEGECYFLLAEEQRKDDLSRAVGTCGMSSFARECMEHLIRSEAKLVALDDPSGLSPVIQTLSQSEYASDAEVIFWQSWALERFAADRMVSMIDCDAAPDIDLCVVGMKRARRTLLIEGGREMRCQALAEGRSPLVLSDGRPALNTSIPVDTGECTK